MHRFGFAGAIMVSFVFLSFYSLGAAPPPLDPVVQEQATRLIGQLADLDFQVREKAQAELDRLGVAIEPALLVGSKSQDPEVRDVCLRLLNKVQAQLRKNRLDAFLADKDDHLDPPIPGWSRYKQLVGGSEAERKRFAIIYTLGGSTLEELEREPKNSVAINRCIDSLRVALLTPGKEAETIAEINAHLLTLIDPRIPLDDAIYNRICSVLMILPNRLPVLTALRDHEPSRKLLRALIIDRSNPKTLAKVLQASLGLELPELRDWAIALARDTKLPGEVRGYALLVLTQIKPKEAKVILEPFLADLTPVGTFKLGMTELKTELRDVALAALIQSAGQKLDTYPFPYFQAIPGLTGFPAPIKLGFVDAATRENAQKKWRENQAKPSK